MPIKTLLLCLVLSSRSHSCKHDINQDISVPSCSSFLSLLLPPVSCKLSVKLCAIGRRAGSRTMILPSVEKRIPRAASTSRSRGGQLGRPARRSGSHLNALHLTLLICFRLPNWSGLIRLMKVNETLQSGDQVCTANDGEKWWKMIKYPWLLRTSEPHAAYLCYASFVIGS